MTTSTLSLWIVDDEPAMCLGVARALDGFTATYGDLDESVTYCVGTMESGEAFMDRLNRESPPQLLLLDGKLPGMEGIEVLRLLGERHAPVVTIMITAYATLENAVRATKLGAFDFLAKPFTPAELRHTVAKASREIILTRRARQLEEEKRRVRFEFISVLAHELKSPLAAVEGYLDMLRNQAPEELLDRATARIHGMRKLIADLLDLTALESGRRRRELASVDLVEIARQAAAGFAAAAAGRNVTVAVTDAPPCLLSADRGELEMLLGNLVSNAIKYNRPGGQVTVVVEGAEDGVTLRVTDTGIGISAADRETLFAEFSRIRNSRTRGIEGSGLGLSIVSRIAALYGGNVSVESEEGKGSTFIVTLPGK